MDFIHEDRDFDDLLRVVAQQHGLPIGLIKKDYWVTHALWAIQHQGFAIWFKGGTSLSKGFNLIERFSEDLDVKIEAGNVTELPHVTDWVRGSRRATQQRQTYFEALSKLLHVPGAEIRLSVADDEAQWKSADLEVHYPGQDLDTLNVLSPFVRLEVGSARVVPFLKRDLSSFVQDHLEASGRIADYRANRPRAVRCVHPLVTLIEKLDNLHRRVRRFDGDPARFVRHFEDAARIAASASELPALAGYPDVFALAREMLEERQIRQLPASSDPAFAPANDERWHQNRSGPRGHRPDVLGQADRPARCL